MGCFGAACSLFAVWRAATRGRRADTIRYRPPARLTLIPQSRSIRTIMEDKRTFLVIGLCLVVLLGWSYLSEYMGWTPRPVPAEQSAQAPQPAAAPTPAVVVVPEVFTPSEGREVRVETPLYTAVFHSGGGVLRSFSLKKYALDLSADSPRVNLISAEAAQTCPMGLIVNGKPSWGVEHGQWAFEGGDLHLAAGGEGSLTFRGEVDGVRVTRVLSFSADSYLINETVLLGTPGGTGNVRLGFTLGATTFGESSRYDPMRLGWSNDGSYKEDTDSSDLAKKILQETGTFPWAGVMNNYFMTMVAPAETANLTLRGLMQGPVWRVGLERSGLVLTPGQETPVAVSWWLGPKDRSLLASAPNDLASAVNFGFFSVIARPLLVVLEFFHKLAGNWGVAILLLTLCIRVVFWPLSQKSYKSMEKMKKIQPMMQKLREKYGDDRESLNREVMQLYKTYGVNPAGGCLPILVQIPVFIGLYQALLNSINLRHASFITYLPFTDRLWLADLAAKDPYYITPLLMGATMFLQQKLSPPAGDPTQQKVMLFLPAVFTVMFLNFPAGLVLYWLCNNVLSIGQQWWMLRRA